jgi:uncharacterized protein YejL (UPF0352 family)
MSVIQSTQTKNMLSYEFINNMVRNLVNTEVPVAHWAAYNPNEWPRPIGVHLD